MDVHPDGIAKIPMAARLLLRAACLSLTAQLAWEMWCSAKKSSHAWASDPVGSEGGGGGGLGRGGGGSRVKWRQFD